MDDFFNPKSMVTPGAAGSLMMLIANTLCFWFPELAFRYVALGLSFLMGAFIIARVANMDRWTRGTLWTLNSLVIFSVGLGTSNVAANVEHKAKSGDVAAFEWLDRATSSFVPNAFAQTANSALSSTASPNPSSSTLPIVTGAKPTKTSVKNGKDEALAAEIARINAENQKLREQLEAAKVTLKKEDVTTVKASATADKGQTTETFFKRW